MKPDRAVRLRVCGHVQGVGFRAFIQSLAQVLGLNGWVRNRRDGTVEAVISGFADDVEALTERVRRGPGRVEEVRIEEVAADSPDAPTADGEFAIRSTV